MLSVNTGKEVSLMFSRVDKRNLTRHTPAAQYYLVGIHNYVVWCLNDTGLTYIIISLALYCIVDLGIIKGAKRHLFCVVDSREKQFIGYFKEQVE